MGYRERRRRLIRVIEEDDMADTLNLRVGPLSQSDGSLQDRTRASKSGATVVSQAHGKYFEAAGRGTVFGACHAAGAAPGTTISTTAHLALYNPQNSGYLIVVHKVRTAYVSGTIGTGTMFHCINTSTTQTAPSSGNAPTVVCLSGGSTETAVGVVRAGATVVAPTVIAPYCTLAPILATSVVHPTLVWEDIDGEIVLQPGTSYQLQSIAAAGTSPLLASGVTWEEIPIP